MISPLQQIMQHFVLDHERVIPALVRDVDRVRPHPQAIATTTIRTVERGPGHTKPRDARDVTAEV